VSEVGQLPPRSPLRFALALTVLIAYTGFILAMTLSPSQLDVTVQRLVLRLVDVLHRYGVPTWFGYGEVEFLANIGMFIPFGFIFALLLPVRWAWVTVVVSGGFSSAIEWFQREFLDERVSSIWDVVANTTGGFAGFVLAATLRAIVHSRDRRVIARALWQARRGLPPTG
jgi:glycopeptide antibiotics resistance protein